MAPTRRKGASKAAAAVAAARQFKVGDLVLAKVKGFPAWPAKVSVPEEWGFAPDPRKVHVFFFGTQQIAFCSPADVEAFTEEKKVSLVNRRHGKGSDFVRAVQEIVDSYEKLNKKDLVNGINSSEGITLTNCRDPVESPAIHDTRQTTGTLADSPDSQQNASTCPDKNGSNIRNIDATLVNSLHGEDASTEELGNSVIAKVMPSIATYSSRKRSSGSRAKRLIASEVITSRDRSRSSSRLESRRLQRRLKTNSGGSSDDMVSNSSQDGLRRRSRRIRKPTITFEGDDTQSLSNGTTEVNDSDIAAVNSDSSSLSECSKMGRGCEPYQSGALDCFGGNAELRKGLGIHMKAIVRKKKRKPSRKRATSSAAEPDVNFVKVEDVEVGLHEVTAPTSSCVKRDMGDSKEDGDKHLPLLKRARVRMGKQFSSEEELHNSMPIEGKTEEIKVDMEQKNSTSHSDSSYHAEGFPSVPERASDDSSKETTDLLNSRAQFWQVKNNESFGCSMDGEATLPPSKRLHRALEAMSANTSEEEPFFAEASLTLKTKVSESSIPFMPPSPNKAMAGEEGTRTGPSLKSDNSPSHNGSQVSQVGVTEARTSLSQIITEENTKSSIVLTIDNQLDNTKSQKNEVPRDMLQERVDYIDCRTLSDPSSGRFSAEAPVQNSRHLSTHVDQEASNCCNVISPKDMQPSKNEYQIEANMLGDSGHEHINKEHSVSGESGMSSISLTIVERAGQGPTQSDMTGSCYKACEEKVLLKSQVNESSQVDSMCDIVKEHKFNERRMATSSLIISNDHIEDKGTKGVHLILSPTGEVVSPVHISPFSATLYHISTSESVADEGKVDSAVTQRPKSLGKSNYVEAQAALSSFEAMLGTLTRTKESIGRATRMAVDCAKFGTAAKVIEILMCHLENEPNLHRRVDLFFLVDSIAQCSRSLKGSVGGAYPSAIQGALPRLLSATAPPGSENQENRRQCLKVLRLWSERRILPESFIRHHMRELDSVGGLAAVYSRRSLRTERALDDPVRDMGSMLVDEYGSNSSFQLPGLCMPCMLKDEDDGSDSDGGSFEAVTPEHKSEMPEERDMMPLTERRGHILEDVDGELEMEDVAPSYGESAHLETVEALENHPEQTLPQQSSHPLHLEVASSSPQQASLLPPETAATAQLTSVSAASDYCPDKNMHGNFRQSVSQTSVSRHNNSYSSSGHYRTPEYNKEPQMRIVPPETSNSFNGFHSRPGNNFERGSSFQNKAQTHRPPHPLSSQFSHIHGEQHVKSRRETPRHCYSNRYNSCMNRGNYYNNHERTKPGPYDHRGGWRGPAPSFPGPRYPDKKAAYAHTPYMDHLGEPMRVINDGWNMPPRPWNHRNSAPYRPHPESSFPVSNRGPGFWRPR